MKIILFIIDTLETGGAEKSLVAISTRFKKYNPTFIHLFPGDTLKPKLKENGIPVISLNLIPDYNFKRMAISVLESIKGYDVSLIHSTLFRSDQVARIIAKKLNIPLINSLVNNSYAKIRYLSLSPTQKLKLKFIEYLDKSSADSVDLFISNSNSIKLSNSKALSIPEAKIKVIFRGRDTKLFSQIENKDSIKAELNISDEKIFLNVSRLLDRKGQLELLEAFYLFSKTIEKSILLIAGEGPYRNVLELRIKELKLDSKVILLGNRTDVPALLKLADYFVFTSHYEGLPGALIEAMMAKTPIIASDIPENLECVNSENSLIFPVGKVEVLSETMLKAQEIDWRPKLKKAYEFASENFDINEIAREYENTYDELLENKEC